MRRITIKGRRNRKKRFAAKRRPINVLASALTCAGLYCGMASILAAIDQQYIKAAYLIFGSIIFDILDGTVAKLTNTTSEFGKQLDSLCDLVSFGAAPAVLIYTAYLAEERAEGSPVGHYGALMAIIFVICGALRLARYNVYQAGSREFFTGLPIPGAAGTIASFVLFTHYYGWHVAFYVLSPLTLGLAYLMVSTVRYPKDKMKTMVLTPRNAFPWLFLVAVLIAVLHYAFQKSPALVLFPAAAAYVLFGIADELYHRIRKRGHYAPVPESASKDNGENITKPFDSSFSA